VVASYAVSINHSAWVVGSLLLTLLGAALITLGLTGESAQPATASD
jgi:hypothetical protein